MARRLQSISDLSQYCLRKLGGGVNEIEITDDQIIDRIGDAIDFFVDRHYDGSEEIWFAHQVTGEDVKNGTIQMPYSIRCVVDVQAAESSLYSPYGISIPGIGVISNPLSPMDIAGSTDYGFGNMTGYYIQRSYIELMNDLTRPQPWIGFNHATCRLTLHGHTLTKNSIVMVHGYKAVDAEESLNVYNDIWLKKYTTALLKQQWGANLKKYNGVKLPGDIEINGQEIYNEASDEIKELVEEFEDRYEFLPSLAIG